MYVPVYLSVSYYLLCLYMHLSVLLNPDFCVYVNISVQLII